MKPLVRRCRTDASARSRSTASHPTGDGNGARVAVVDTGIDGRIRDRRLVDRHRAARRTTPRTHARREQRRPPRQRARRRLPRLLGGPRHVRQRRRRAGGTDSRHRASTARSAPPARAARSRSRCALIRAVRDGRTDRQPLARHADPVRPALARARRGARRRPGDREPSAARRCSSSRRPATSGTPRPSGRLRSGASSRSVALTADLRPSTFSSRGWWVDCSAVGEGILSTFVDRRAVAGLHAANPRHFPENAFARWSGTSFAAPQVAGAIARLMHEHGPRPRDAYVQLLARASPCRTSARRSPILPGV